MDGKHDALKNGVPSEDPLLQTEHLPYMHLVLFAVFIGKRTAVSFSLQSWFKNQIYLTSQLITVIIVKKIR